MNQFKPVLITTSGKPSDSTRQFSRLLGHIIPNSTYITRGKKTFNEILDLGFEKQAEFILILNNHRNRIGRIHVVERQKQTYKVVSEYLEIMQFIDHKIFGFQKIPARGPISCPVHTSHYQPKIYSFFEKYFRLQYNVKTDVWLMADQQDDQDKKNHPLLIHLQDALSQKRFAMFKVRHRINKKIDNSVR